MLISKTNFIEYIWSQWFLLNNNLNCCFLTIRSFSIWPSATIYIFSVFIVSFFRSNTKSIIWPEELISSCLKLSLPASKKHMLYSTMQIPFGRKKTHFWPESGQEQHQQLKTHELKSEVMVKDGGQIEDYLIIKFCIYCISFWIEPNTLWFHNLYIDLELTTLHWCAKKDTRCNNNKKWHLFQKISPLKKVIHII